jgi:HlyD family secretion protein
MWMNPDLKVYNSDIYLEEDDHSLRTGMSCKVEIIVEEYDDVIFIPIQAVVRVGGKPTVYVVSDGTIDERQVEIGLDNNRMVHVLDGLVEGEAVLLTPPLKPAAVETGSRLRETDDSRPDTPEPAQERVRKRPEEARSGREVERKSTEV